MKLPTSFPNNLYQAYSYSYPHKSAYRDFDQSVELKAVWQEEKKDALFLYLHVPFCEMRCGFCNLFTIAKPAKQIVDEYLDALERQVIATAKSLGDHQFVRFAVGGGTPTYLNVDEWQRVFDILSKHLNILTDIPISVETSPETIDADKIAFFESKNVQRLSIGVQSFSSSELSTLIRRQKDNEVDKALKLIKNSNVPILNLDLIYGIEGQNMDSWKETLTVAISYQPEEIYLYPLYLREKTGMDTVNQRKGLIAIKDENSKSAMYQFACEKLQALGYRQVSMRMFRKTDVDVNEGPVYCCQSDGMLGLGAGARSYTTKRHYCSEYAVSRKSVKAIIENYNQLSLEQFEQVEYGFKLSHNEQKHRHVIQSLLVIEGFNLTEYRNKFASDPLKDFPQLLELVECQLAGLKHNIIKLTKNGLALSDAIGPWLISAEVSELMEEYQIL